MSVRPTRRSDVMVDPAADGVLVRMPRSASVTWLNRTAILVFELCTGANDTDAIARALQHAFDLNEAPVAAVEAAIADLVAAGLVEPVRQRPPTLVTLTIALWAPAATVPTDALTHLQAIRTDAERAGIATALTIDRSRSMRTARNRAASAAVREATASHVLFLDSSGPAIDAVLDADLTSLVARDHDVIGIPVPVGEPMWERARDAAAALPDLTANELRRVTQGYDIALPVVTGPREIEDGCVVGKQCSSAAMLVQRSALERIAGVGVTPRNTGTLAMGVLSTEGGWGFFDPGRSREGIDLDEDLAFCERVRASGGRVMIDATGGFGTHLDIAERLRVRRAQP